MLILSVLGVLCSTSSLHPPYQPNESTLLGAPWGTHEEPQVYGGEEEKGFKVVKGVERVKDVEGIVSRKVNGGEDGVYEVLGEANRCGGASGEAKMFI